MFNTPIHKLKENCNDNEFYIKRDDLIGFSFGGNKARKAMKFKDEILKHEIDAIVTYGSSESNHCRIVSNMAAMLNKKCYIISPQDDYVESYNSKMVKMFDANIIKVPISEIKITINNLMKKLSETGKPYFIQGGGHGNLGTEAYIDCFNEIMEFEDINSMKFDYVFVASGTGTTQAGLVCGQIMNNDINKKIVGISIARNYSKGRQVIIDSVRDYLGEKFNDELIVFDDSYTLGGYNKHNSKVISTIKKVLFNEGIPLNATYTGKAFWGMLEYIAKNNIKHKKILFINTGGLPLFFDNMEELIR